MSELEYTGGRKKKRSSKGRKRSRRRSHVKSKRMHGGKLADAWRKLTKSLRKIRRRPSKRRN